MAGRRRQRPPHQHRSLMGKLIYDNVAESDALCGRPLKLADCPRAPSGTYRGCAYGTWSLRRRARNKPSRLRVAPAEVTPGGTKTDAFPRRSSSSSTTTAMTSTASSSGGSGEVMRLCLVQVRAWGVLE